MAEIPWKKILEERNKQDWKWVPGGGLQCPQGHLVPLKRVEPKHDRLIFLTRRGICGDCNCRTLCSQSLKPSFRHRFSFKVEPEFASRIKKLKQKRLPSIKIVGFTEFKNKKTPFNWSEAPKITEGPFAVSSPKLDISKLRRQVSNFDDDFDVFVIGTQLGRPARNPFVAETDARRQRRRLTWDERYEWNAANGDFQVFFSGQAPGHFDRLMEVLTRKTE